MTIITDGLLIATCLTAALYCIVLSRRLARFSDTKSGIGQQIAQLNSILEETRTTIRDSHSGAKSVSERLSRDLAGAKKSSQDLSALIEQAETALDRALELQTQDRRPPDRPQEQVRDPGATADRVRRPAPVQETVQPSEDPEPLEELQDDDIAERDFDLAGARGEPQLGFLPSISDSSAMSEAPLDDDTPGDRPDELPEGSSTEDSSKEDSENLLKVERMAL